VTGRGAQCPSRRHRSEITERGLNEALTAVAGQAVVANRGRWRHLLDPQRTVPRLGQELPAKCRQFGGHDINVVLRSSGRTSVHHRGRLAHGAILAGLFTGLSLIIAIGPKCLRTSHGSFETARRSDRRDLCRLRHRPHHPWHRRRRYHRPIRSVALQVLRWVGVAYLSLFAVRSFWRALRPGVLLPSPARRPTTNVVVTTTLRSLSSILTSISTPSSCSDRLAINTTRALAVRPRGIDEFADVVFGLATERDSRLV